MDHSVQSLPTMPATVSRKRSRENESPSQRHKREKAAERQRRKRERDRAQNMAPVSVVPMPPPPQQQQQQHQQQQQPPPPQPMPVPPLGVPGDFPPAPPPLPQAHVAPEDMAKRERIRMAARERQRKHRAIVKQKKMRELGLDMGNDILPGMTVDDVSYRMDHPPHFAVLQPAHPHPHEMQPPPGAPPMPPPHDGFPPPQSQLGGQTFASTLLLSFACAPLLKAHLLRTLGMSNEELASLEPIIASAWDQWDYQRRIHHAAQAHAHAQAQAQAQANGLPPPEDGAQPYGEVPTEEQQHEHEQAYEQQQQQQDQQQHQQQQQEPVPPPPPNDFRARFARSLVVPPPFRTFDPQPPQGDALEQHLAEIQKAAIDPELGQARGEAEGVVGRLERG
ncbi:hypothetical protein OF83DRAFT_1179753 [Amylostereum chailletii]|nr:hypothetical protein OF83DRAFT_1179753 [Amylostereum chailletii]